MKNLFSKTTFILRFLLISALATGLFLIITYIILAKEQQQLSLQENEALQIYFDEYAKVVDRKFFLVKNQVDILRREAEYQYNKTELVLSKKDQKIYNLLVDMEKGFHAINLSKDQRARIGALNGIGSYKNRNKEFNRELKVLILLSQNFYNAYRSVKDLTWVHSFTENRIAKIYPWISSDQLHLKDLENLIYESSGDNSEEWYWRARPDFNPHKKILWSKAYHDGFGKGIMTTAFAPIYDGSRFAGTIGLDLLVDNLNQIMHDFSKKRTGTLILIDHLSQILAYPDRITSNDKKIYKLIDILPHELEKFTDKILSSKKIDQKIFEDWKILKTDLESAPFYLIYTEKQPKNFIKIYRRIGIKWLFIEFFLGIIIAYLISMLNKRSKQVAKRSRELLVEKENAEKANKAKSTFLATMSHELRTPMNAILGFLQLMQHDTSLNKQQLKYLETIDSNGRHLLSLINEVLEISKIESGHIKLKLTHFDLYSMLDDLLSMFQFRDQKQNLMIKAKRDTNLPRIIIGDESKLRQIIINLLSNAVKFTKNGSIVLHSYIESPYSNGVIGITFDVIDTGLGIQKHELASIFKPFEQSESGRNTIEGTGLGLPISQEYAHLMDGNITVKSHVGKGSIFTLKIFVQIGEKSSIKKIDHKKRVTSLITSQKSWRILVVDDNPNNRELLVKILAPVGFTMREASSGEESLQMTNEWYPDLILMDIRMPGMDGFEATQRIKASKAGRKIPIIAISASVFDDDINAILAVGCNDFLRKPICENELFESIKRSLKIEYKYESTCLESNPTQNKLTQQQITSIPNTLSIKLQKALKMLDVPLINSSIKDIIEYDQAIGVNLKSLADSFAYDKLLDMIALNIKNIEDNI